MATALTLTFNKPFYTVYDNCQFENSSDFYLNFFVEILEAKKVNFF